MFYLNETFWEFVMNFKNFEQILIKTEPNIYLKNLNVDIKCKLIQVISWRL